MPRPRASAGPDSRARLLAAATDEFAAQGLAGASVDRIARKARLNKAMVYYHFEGKEALYREAIRATFATVAGRVRGILESPRSPVEKLAGFVEGFVEEASRRPSFPRMVMREMSESGRHLDLETARTWMGVPEAFFRILQEGIDQQVFRSIHPLFALLSIIGPVVLTLASEPARARVGRLVGRPLPDIDRGQLIAYARATAFAVILREPTAAPFKGVPHVSPVEPSAEGPRRPRRVPRQRVRR